MRTDEKQYNNPMKNQSRQKMNFGTERPEKARSRVRFSPLLRDCPELMAFLQLILDDRHVLNAFIENHQKRTYRRTADSRVVLCSLPHSFTTQSRQCLCSGGLIDNIVIKMESSKQNLHRFRPVSKAFSVLGKSAALLEAEIPHLVPLAGAKMPAPGGPHSVVVTAGSKNTCDLYHYLARLENFGNLEVFAQKAAISEKLGEIFARLHQNRLRHRDAKAQNFLVVPQPDGPNVILLDLDGIRQNPFPRFTYLINAMAKLAATVMHSPEVTRTDCLRVLRRLSILLAITRDTERSIARLIWQKAIATRLTTMIRSIKAENLKPMPGEPAVQEKSNR